MTKAITCEVQDNYGYWNDVTGDLIGADAKGGFDDSNLLATNKRMPPPGKLTIRLNNSAKKYTPLQDTPKSTDFAVPWRRCRLRVGTPSMGNCLRMMSSGMGAPGTNLNTNRSEEHTSELQS